MNETTRALIASASSGMIIGAAMVATGSVVDDAGPVGITFIRYFVGVIFLLPVAFQVRWRPVSPRDLAAIVILGIFQFAVLIVLLNFSVIYIEVSLSLLIFATLPLQTMLIAIALGQEHFTGRKLIGILLTIVGVGYAVGATSLAQPLGEDGWWGVLAAFASALVGALCSVFYRPYLIRYPTSQVSTMAMAASVLVLAGLAVAEGLPAALPAFDFNVWAALIFIGLSSSIGYSCWLYGLRHTVPSNVTVFLGLSPISAAIIAAIFIAQPLTTADIIGSLLVALGLVVSLWQRRSKSAAIP